MGTEGIIEINGRKYVPIEYHQQIVKNLLKENKREICSDIINKLQSLRERMRTWHHCFIADLHVGSNKFDIIALDKILDTIKREHLRVDTLHILGDIIEGKPQHHDQESESFPPDIQQELVVQTIIKMAKVLHVRVINIISGIHDLRHSIDLLDSVVKTLREDFRGLQINYYRDSEFYVYDNVFGIHYIEERDDDCRTFDEWMYSDLLKEILKHDLWHKIKYIVVGHCRNLMVKPYLDKLIISVPSFQWTIRSRRNERGVVLVRNNEVKIISVPSSREGEILEYWRKAVRI